MVDTLTGVTKEASPCENFITRHGGKTRLDVLKEEWRAKRKEEIKDENLSPVLTKAIDKYNKLEQSITAQLSPKLQKEMKKLEKLQQDVIDIIAAEMWGSGFDDGIDFMCWTKDRITTMD